MRGHSLARFHALDTFGEFRADLRDAQFLLYGKDPDEGLDKLEKERRELAAIATRTPEQDKRLKDVQNLIDWHHQPPASEGFLKDILTDAQGTSFHRLQMFIWTLVLVFVFGWEVYDNLAMPDFNNSLLALMGISAGTYIGFMIPEKHSSQQQT